MEAVSNRAVNDPRLSLGVGLRCPRCKTVMREFDCSFCTFRIQITDGIVVALPQERKVHYAAFMKDYERIRTAEGRGSERAEFYLSLPYKDTSGKNSGQWHIRGRSFHYLLNKILKKSPELDNGKILDLGSGNCWMSFRLSLAGYHPVALDLLTNDRDGLAAAEHYRSRVPNLFPRFQAEISSLPFDDEQFDAVIFNASFHYSEDFAASLNESLRCVKPGGMVVVSDTPWYSTDASGRQMVFERRASYFRRYGTASDSIKSLEYLTDERLRTLEEKCSVQWTVHSPAYGFKWGMRPFLAKLSGKREPSRFRIYVARKKT